LAAYDPGDPRWPNFGRTLVDKLLADFLTGWGKALEPIGKHLVQPLVEVLNDPRRSETDHSVAANLLADYARELPGTLAELIKSVDAKHAAVLLRPLLKYNLDAARSMNAELGRTLVPDWKVSPPDPAWKAPDQAAVHRLEAAQGLLAERFAFCQT